MAPSFLAWAVEQWGSHLLKWGSLEEGQVVRKGANVFTFEYVKFEMFLDMEILSKQLNIQVSLTC